MRLTLRLLEGELTIVRLPAESKLPKWFPRGEAAPLCSFTRTDKELSLICPAKSVPGSVMSETGWRALRVEDALEFAATGVLASILKPLAEARVNILSVSTFETDYVLVPGGRLREALDALLRDFNLVS